MVATVSAKRVFTHYKAKEKYIRKEIKFESSCDELILEKNLNVLFDICKVNNVSVIRQIATELKIKLNYSTTYMP